MGSHPFLVSGVDSSQWLVMGAFLVILVLGSFVFGVLSARRGQIRAMEKRSVDESHSQFLSDISHDIRTPLTAIRGYVETLLLKGESCPAPQRKEFLEVVMNNIEQLSHLVDELFEFTKVKESAGKRKFEEIDLVELVRSIVRRLSPSAEKKSIQLSLEIAAEPIVLSGDKAMLDRAITNVVNNAIYYTKAGGNVQIQVAPAESVLQLKISDTGIGIPAADLEHIFDRFYRVNKDRSRETGGSGLGLAITKTIIDSHNGNIAIQSELGIGTTVTIELPVEA